MSLIQNDADSPVHRARKVAGDLFGEIHKISLPKACSPTRGDVDGITVSMEIFPGGLILSSAVGAGDLRRLLEDLGHHFQNSAVENIDITASRDSVKDFTVCIIDLWRSPPLFHRFGEGDRYNLRRGDHVGELNLYHKARQDNEQSSSSTHHLPIGTAPASSKREEPYKDPGCSASHPYNEATDHNRSLGTL